MKLSSEKDSRIAKARLLSEYKEIIINNFETMSYPLFNILSSEEELELCDGYSEIINISKLKKPVYTGYKDELYILNTLSSFLDKTPLSNESKESARQKVLEYKSYFNHNSERAS